MLYDSGYHAKSSGKPMTRNPVTFAILPRFSERSKYLEAYSVSLLHNVVYSMH